MGSGRTGFSTKIISYGLSGLRLRFGVFGHGMSLMMVVVHCQVRLKRGYRLPAQHSRHVANFLIISLQLQLQVLFNYCHCTVQHHVSERAGWHHTILFRDFELPSEPGSATKGQ